MIPKEEYPEVDAYNVFQMLLRKFRREHNRTPSELRLGRSEMNEIGLKKGSTIKLIPVDEESHMSFT